MRDLLIHTSVVTLLLLVHIESSLTLNCYQCDDVGSITDCQHVVSCSSDESCYTDTTGTGSNTRYTLGCRTKQICRHPNSVPQGALIGRAVAQDIVCSQCCGVNACNRHICARSSIHGLHTNQCADDPDFNCQQVSELFDVCNDQDHAKLVCRKFCDLCDIVDGNWLEWSSWSICSHTCGNGTLTRTRACNRTDDGLPCPGNSSDYQQCFNTACPVDGGWTSWSSWGSCSVSCGAGLIKRDRHCTNPSPGPFGHYCDGYSLDTKVCLLTSCTDGAWTSWSDWGTCSASCEGGISRRNRNCNTTVLGHSCVGNDEESRVCNTQLCLESFANDGWTMWSSWSTCSAYCMSERTRTCSNQVPSAYGKNCVGSSKEKKNCNQEYCSHSVRLVNGSDPYEGRLEVYHNGQWGTVCNNNFTNTDADVVCRMLNYDGVPVVNMSAANNQESLPILLDNVSCTGTEDSFFDCSHLSWGDYHCGHSEEVGVSCHGDIQVRLEGGTSNITGRVEFSRGDNVWGSVCDIGFDKTHAEIVCKMLSMPTNTTIIYKARYYGSGSGESFVTDFSCSSSETNLGKCGHFATSDSSCKAYYRNVGIACVSDLHIRLADGTRSQNGRVEASVDGNTWGPICDTKFDNRDANVICRTLGYSGNRSIAYPSGRFGRGSGQNILSDLGCSGSEQALADCNLGGVVSTSCPYSVSVDCITDIGVRLVNGTNIHSGRVEVSLDGGNWGPMCDQSFTSLDAKVICRMLGYSTNLAFPYYPYYASRFGQGTTQSVLSYPECNGSESSVADCTFGGSNTCNNVYDVGVNCIENIHVRLVNGTTKHNGRVEISTDGHTWGPLCDSSFSIHDAKAVCTTLGYPTNVTLAYTFPHYGQGTTPNILSYLECSGSENSIADCRLGPVSSTCSHRQDNPAGCGFDAETRQRTCSHAHDVSLECSSGLHVRLANGSSGRLEVSVDGTTWGTVCRHNFNYQTAVVVCKMLGLPWSNAAVTNTPAGSGQVILRDLQCTGSETSITDCTHTGWGQQCPYYYRSYATGVSCA